MRSFQTGGLFATLTVEETLALAQERADRTRASVAMLGSSRQDRRQRQRARDNDEVVESYLGGRIEPIDAVRGPP